MDSKDQAHEKLRKAMQREISLMREILSNMQQEEISLKHGDQGSWTLVVQERSHMIERLVVFRSERMEATEAIKRLNSSSTIALSLDDESTCELFWMRDQMMALLEKMNEQNSRNQSLYPSPFHSHANSSPSSYVPSPATQKKKSSVATEKLG